ncbi:MAG: dephospho-CoA kinase [Planctomycetota bacterium]|nr:dephospho-CoA kinase [Planctomycetota bacterium]
MIGVVGGIASGKSEVSGALQRLGAKLVDADRIGHEVLEDPEVKAAIGQRWGGEVFDAHGLVDRRRVAGIVFAAPPKGPEELTFLEQWTHPRIGQRLREQIAEWARTGRVKAAVLDAPMLLKAGWDTFCDRLLFVDAPREQRLARARRRGWNEAEYDAREAAQESLALKRSRANAIIDNSSSLEYTFAQVDQFWRSHVEPGL